MFYDFDAHTHLANATTEVQEAVLQANEKSHLGIFKVCITDAGDVLVLPEFSASVRTDISDVLYCTDKGFSFVQKDDK